jgi:queuine tRNA-ribosyltransferase
LLLYVDPSNIDSPLVSLNVPSLVLQQATMKGVTPAQLEAITPPITLILNNTYHLSQNPGTEVLDACEGASHGYQGWRGNLLTDSGGFQMVSL